MAYYPVLVVKVVLALFSASAMQYSPVKYNSKLMNSIWGLYNRYSPHNIKGNDDEQAPEYQIKMQQFGSVAAVAITQKLAMGFGSGDEWNFPGGQKH